MLYAFVVFVRFNFLKLIVIMWRLFVSFFFSSRRRHTRCALVTGVQTCALPILPDPEFIVDRAAQLDGLVLTHAHEDHLGAVPYLWPRDRKSVVSGKSVSVRVDLGGRRIIKK